MIPLPVAVEERSPHSQVVFFLLRVVLHKNLNQILLLWASGHLGLGGGYEDGAWKILTEIIRCTCSSVMLPPLCSTKSVTRTSGVPRNFVRGGGSTNSVEDRGQRERGSGSGSPLVRDSGGSCKLAQEISFHIVKFS